MVEKKNNAVMVRFDDADFAVLTELATRAGITEANLTRMALKAVLTAYLQNNKKICIPLEVIITGAEYHLPPSRFSGVNEDSPEETKIIRAR